MGFFLTQLNSPYTLSIWTFSCMLYKFNGKLQQVDSMCPTYHSQWLSGTVEHTYFSSTRATQHHVKFPQSGTLKYSNGSCCCNYRKIEVWVPLLFLCLSCSKRIKRWLDCLNIRKINELQVESQSKKKKTNPKDEVLSLQASLYPDFHVNKHFPKDLDQSTNQIFVLHILVPESFPYCSLSNCPI